MIISGKQIDFNFYPPRRVILILFVVADIRVELASHAHPGFLDAGGGYK
jgi:hypothetical protein